MSFMTVQSPDVIKATQYLVYVVILLNGHELLSALKQSNAGIVDELVESFDLFLIELVRKRDINLLVDVL